MLSRRAFTALSLSLPALLKANAAPVRAITKGPQFHWFGYYDKLEFDPTGRYVLSNQIDFEGKSPKPGDVLRVGMVDLQDNDRWIPLGDTRAWNWQQGCMLQWLPGSRDEVIWNDREEDRFVSRILNIRTHKTRTLPGPIYSISPDARWAIYPDFRRLNRMRPGYGYSGIPDPFEQDLAPAQTGLWRMDMNTGKQSLLFSFADVSNLPPISPGWEKNAKHWFNHLLYSQNGKRLIFLHRWRGPKEGTGFSTRMLTASADGKDLQAVDPYGKTSHFIWRDADHILAWAWHPSRGEKFYLYKVGSDKVEVVGPDAMPINGHCTYLPGNNWILNDTYPDEGRLQHLYLYEVASGKRIDLHSFSAAPQYTGELRCDLHPRSSPDGTKIVIDSSHNGGRQLYLVDIAGIATH